MTLDYLQESISTQTLKMYPFYDNTASFVDIEVHRAFSRVFHATLAIKIHCIKRSPHTLSYS